MPHSYLSICGDSAVGKITLIKKLLADEENLRERFGIGEGTVDAFGVCYSQGECKRDPEWTKMMHQSEKDVLLFEWQWRDHSIIGELFNSYPNDEHRIILIWRPWKEHWRDFQRKHPQLVENGYSLNTLKEHWRGKWKPIFQKIEEDGEKPVELVNGATHEYDRMEEWPE